MGQHKKLLKFRKLLMILSTGVFFHYSFIKKYDTPPVSESILNILKPELSTYCSMYCNAS